MSLVVEQIIPKGYKQTEVGVIPDDWTLDKLDKLTDLIIDGTHHTPKYTKFGVPFLRVTDINGVLDESKFKYVSAEEHAVLIKRAKPELGDLLLSKNGTIGIPKVVNWSWEFSIFVSLALIKPKKKLLNSNYLEQFFKSNFLTKQLEQKAKQGAVTNLHLEEIREILLPMPPSVEEQTTIANALSDMDTLLSELEKLIAKKQAIKIAAMQQLLTGKTRLPQFATYLEGDKKGQVKASKSSELGEIPEDWGVLSIDECSIKIGSGKTPTGGSSVYVDSGRPFVRSQNVGWGQLRLSDLSYITEEIHHTFSGSEIKIDDVLLNITGASIGRCALANQQIEKGNVNQHVCIIRLNSKKVKPYILQTLVNSEVGQNQIDSYQAGGNREGLNFSQVKNLKFSFSSIPKEQTAIANILLDMDEEIQALQQRLSKTRQIKQGMMQELLTGKIRLIQGEAHD